MDQATEQNAAMVEESNAASATLAEESQKVCALVGRFTLGAAPSSGVGALRAAARMMAQPVRPVPAAKSVATKPAARAASSRSAAAQS